MGDKKGLLSPEKHTIHSHHQHKADPTAELKPSMKATSTTVSLGNSGMKRIRRMCCLRMSLVVQDFMESAPIKLSQHSNSKNKHQTYIMKAIRAPVNNSNLTVFLSVVSLCVTALDASVPVQLHNERSQQSLQAHLSSTREALLWATNIHYSFLCLVSIHSGTTFLHG